MPRELTNHGIGDAGDFLSGRAAPCAPLGKNDCETHHPLRNATYTSFAYPPAVLAPPDPPACSTDMTRSRFFLYALAAYAVLSVADFALTHYLLVGSDGH